MPTRNSQSQLLKNVDLTRYIFTNPALKDHTQSALVRQTQFNKQGYVGEEFAPLADHHIVICGGNESYIPAFSGVDTWWDIFASRYAFINNIERSRINVLNFSQPEGSMEYVVRTLVSQTQILQPSIVILSLCPLANSEYISRSTSNETIEFALCLGELVKDNVKSAPFNHSNTLADHSIDTEQWHTILDSAAGYFAHYSTTQALRGYAKNLILLDNYFQQLGVPCLYWSAENSFPTDELMGNPHMLNPTIEKSVIDEWPVHYLDINDRNNRDITTTASHCAEIADQLAKQYEQLIEL